MTISSPRRRHRGRARFLRQLRRSIRQQGYAVAVALPSLDGPGWAYTVGLRQHALPELILIGGISPPEQYVILDSLARRMCRGERFEPGQRDGRILEDAEVTFVEVVDTDTEHFEVVNQLQSGYRALQVVWPDADQRYPWDDGYDVPADFQPLLGLPGEPVSGGR